MKPIRLRILDLWRGFDERDNWFTDLLTRHFPIEFSDDPEFVMFSEKSTGWEQHRGIRIFYTPENVRPNMDRCDWAFSFDHLDHSRHYRLPLYRLYHSPETLIKAPWLPLDPRGVLDRKFCNFLYSNSRAQERTQFFDILSAYKLVEACGRVRRNSNTEVVDKVAYLRNFKFTIAFENSSQSGYSTEKVVDPMVAMSLPIYWGNPELDRDFDTSAVVNVMSFASLEEAAERVLHLDADDDAYLEVLSRPWFRDDVPPSFLSEAALVDQFDRIFTSDVCPVGSTMKERRSAAAAHIKSRARRYRSARR